jgi:hypothetical protein
MTVQNGTISGVTLLAASVDGQVNTISTAKYARKAYAVYANFPAYTGSSDTATITGILTAINAATRNGKALTLIGTLPLSMGTDTAGVTAHFTGTAVSAGTLSNTTTTGDVAGQLSDAALTEIATTTAVSGVGIICVVDETGT